MASCWDVLGIEPTADPDMVRRAYAARLKQLSSDSQAFIALRKAYEAALKQSSIRIEVQQPKQIILPAGLPVPDVFVAELAEALVQPDPAVSAGCLDRYGRLAVPMQLAQLYEAVALRRIQQIPYLPLDRLTLLRDRFGWGDVTHALARGDTGAYMSFVKRLDAAKLRHGFEQQVSRGSILRFVRNSRAAAKLILGKKKPFAGAFNDAAVLRLAKLNAQAVQANSPEAYQYFDPIRVTWLVERHRNKIIISIQVAFCFFGAVTLMIHSGMDHQEIVLFILTIVIVFISVYLVARHKRKRLLRKAH